MAAPAEEMFRREAIEHQNHPSHEGHVLHISPALTRAAYWLVVVACLTAVVYIALAHIHEYAGGPALVRVDGRTDVTARAAGTVAEVAVRPGQRVAAGDLLVNLYGADESFELKRIDHEFELLLVKLLRDPGDAAARQALTTLRAQRELAEARVGERTLRAPHAGIVSDVRVRPGQNLAPGDLLVSLVGDDASFSIVALMPGEYRPLLHPGQPLRLELAGYRYAYQQLTVDSVSDAVVGPTEARRFLGQEVADVVAGAGPVVIVRARVPSRDFIVDGRALQYHDGMTARAEVVVRSEPILLALVPALRALVRGPGT